MEYTVLFEIDSFSLSIIHIILIFISIFFALYVGYSFKKRKPIIEKVLSIIVFAVFSVVSIYTITTSNIVAMEMSSILKNQECFVVEGDVTSFHTPTALGHDVESFYIDDVYFEYSNSDEVGYSKTKAFGGCINGEGQNLRISYVSVEGRNIILRIEEII